jgi:hypothetical protein
VKRTTIIAAVMLVSLILLQRQTTAEVHIPLSEFALTSGIDSRSDQETCEFVIAAIDGNLPVRMSAPQDLDIYRNTNSETAPFTSHLSAKTANKGIILKNNILLKLRI